MYNIRTLFNMRRFVGCQSPRQRFSATGEGDANPLSLSCEETPEGAVQLILHDGIAQFPAAAYPLPTHVQKRIRFWDNWVSYLLRNEWEHPICPYGPEAYAVSIAINIAAAYPDCCIDWCGLPVHDEYELLLYIVREKQSGRFRSLPNGMVPNSYLLRLRQQSQATMGHLPGCGLKGTFCDYYDEAVLEYITMNDLQNRKTKWEGLGGIHHDEHYPEWLEDQVYECGMLYGYDIAYECYGWSPCPVLHSFLADACSIDIMRHHPKHVPVCSSDYYLAHPDDFPAFRP